MRKTTNRTRTTKAFFSERLLFLQPRHCLSRLCLLLVVALALLSSSSLSSKCFVASFTTATTKTTAAAAAAVDVPVAPILPKSGVVVRSLSRDNNEFDYGYNDNYEKEGGGDDNVVAETTGQQQQQQQQQHSYQYQYEQQQLRRRSRRANAWILLVDDEEPIRRAVGQFFLDKGFGTVTTCADGRAALEAVAVATATAARQKRSQQQERDGSNNNNNNNTITNDNNNNNNNHQKHNVPDCIVSDVRMPGMDGLELLNHIRQSSRSDPDSHSDSEVLAQQLARVPVVLVSARAMLRDRIAGYDAGADAYLTKPFSADELLAIVETCLERSEHLEEERARIALDSKPVTPNDLSSEIARIRSLLVHDGKSRGNGLGVVGRNGWVRKTDVFLSGDERAVLELLSRGLITKEIAAKTHLSKRRIEQLLTGMFRKAGVKNRTELVRWAVETGNVA